VGNHLFGHVIGIRGKVPFPEPCFSSPLNRRSWNRVFSVIGNVTPNTV
jgi:hypothetical protein